MPLFQREEMLPCRDCEGLLWRIGDKVEFEQMVVDSGVEVKA